MFLSKPNCKAIFTSHLIFCWVLPSSAQIYIDLSQRKIETPSMYAADGSDNGDFTKKEAREHISTGQMEKCHLNTFTQQHIPLISIKPAPQ